MTEPWIRVHANLIHKPVVGRACDVLGVSLHEAAGLMVAFWGGASQHARRGDMSGVLDAQMETWAGWFGRGRKKGKFAAFVREFHLDADGRIREWEKYAGRLDERREAEESPDGKSTYVYYAVAGNECKIGYSGNPWSRIAELRTARPGIAIAAVERGRKALESERHRQFAASHIDREWFRLTDDLRNHIATVAATVAATKQTTGHSVVSRERNDTKRDVGVVVEELPSGPVELTAQFVTICANRAITERWSEQPSPLVASGAVALVAELTRVGVPIDVARLSIYEQCRESKQGVPPKSINYFKPGILKAWEAEQSRRALAASGEVPPSGASAAPVTGARRESWKDADERREREEGERRMVRDRNGNVEQRRAHDDGPAWWTRMQREAKDAKVNPVLYAFDRMHEPAHVEAAHV